MPAPTPDKVIVTHKARLVAKYTAAGYAAVHTAVTNLIAADLARGLVTVLADLSSAADATKYGFTAIPPAAVGDAKKHKQAIDKVYVKAERPAYLMLLGAVDVIPHVPLQNPVYSPDEDDDKTADGDIPYACAAGYSTDPRKFLAPDRVVGRLPDLVNATDPAYLVGLLATAAGYTPRPRADYDPYLGLSAGVWQISTEMSLDAVFGGHADLQLSPPVDHPAAPAAHLGRLAHFINCHGNTATPRFSGEQPRFAFFNALEAAQLAGAVREGTVAAAECCYGAELYDPALGGHMGVCNTYLREKAYGFLGSSTIAYGPAAGNDLADLICQYFLKHVRAGASVGRACLLARLEYVGGRAATALTPTDLKTLAQFNLLGDPAVTPVAAAVPHAAGLEVKSLRPEKKGLAGAAAAAATRFVLDRLTRDGRRDWLRRYSGAITGAVAVVAAAAAESLIGAKGGKGDSPVARALRQVADEMGMKAPTVQRFEVGGGKPAAKASAKATGAKTMGAKKSAAKAGGPPAARRVHLVTERDRPAAGGNPILIRGFEAIELDGVLTVRKFHSR